MIKIKKTIMGWLTAIMLCMAIIAGFAQINVAYASDSGPADPGEDPVVIAVSVRDRDQYKSLFTKLFPALEGNYIFEYYYDGGMADVQVSNINDMINPNTDILIFDPIDPSALFSVLKDAREEGIELIAFGEPNSEFPLDTYYISDGGFYKLGMKHAKWIYNDHEWDEDPIVRIYYFYDEDGQNYCNGITDELTYLGIYDFEAIGVWDFDDFVSNFEVWFNSTGGNVVNYLVTYSEEVATWIYKMYLERGYHESSSGIGIMVFPSEDYEEVKDYFESAAQKIADAIEKILAGKLVGEHVIDIGFAPGEIKYVEQ